SFLTCATLNAAVAVLELQRSIDAKTWERVQLDPSQLTVTGVISGMHDPKAFYRLKIHDTQHAGFVTALFLSNAPPQAVEIAKRFLTDTSLGGPEAEDNDPEGGWTDAQLGAICFPVYDPAVDAGRTPAYIEFKIVRAPMTPTTI